MGWMGFRNFNDAGNVFVVNSPIPCCLLLNKKRRSTPQIALSYPGLIVVIKNNVHLAVRDEESGRLPVTGLFPVIPAKAGIQ